MDKSCGVCYAREKSITIIITAKIMLHLYCFVRVINRPLEMFGKKTNKRVINCCYWVWQIFEKLENNYFEVGNNQEFAEKSFLTKCFFFVFLCNHLKMLQCYLIAYFAFGIKQSSQTVAGNVIILCWSRFECIILLANAHYRYCSLQT